ncbi:MAG: hypothetical protein JWQ11_4808, partial [Rhizobacter sp.]|nr:hypothetical protein [Rhizobacter sp.]
MVCLIATLGALATLAPTIGRADTLTFSAPFGFTHTGTVSTGLVSIGGTFTSSVTTPSTLTFTKFDNALGKLTGVSVAVATTTSTFSVSPTGLLGLTSAASASRTFGYSVASGAAAGSDSATVSNNPTALLTLLGLGAVELGGAPIVSTRTFSTAADLAQFGGNGTVSVTLGATDALSVTVGISLLNGSGLNGTGSYAGTVAVTYTYSPYVTMSGRAFKDDGIGAGTANDGVRNGGETGIAGLAFQLLDASNAVLDATTSSADGSYRLFVPATVMNGAALRVRQVLPDASVATAASLGTSAGSYTRATSTIALTYAAGTGITGLDFGSVALPSLLASGNQAAAPGTVLFYSHRFSAT